MTIESTANLLTMNLQRFSDEDIVRGGYNPDEEISVPFPSNENENPLLDGEPDNELEYNQFEQFGQDDPQPDDLENPLEPQVPQYDFGGRIVNPNDPESIAGAHQDFQRAQSFITQQQQQIQQMQQMIQMMNNPAMQQQFQQSQFQQQPQQPQEEEFDSDAFMEKFYEDPKGALESVIQKTVAQIEARYEPIVKERQYTEALNQLEMKHPDYQQFIPQMQQVVQEVGEGFVDQYGLEAVYQMAKGRAYQPPQMPDVNSIVNSPEFFQRIAQNPMMQQLVLQQTMQHKQQQRPPHLMGNRQGGTVNLAPTERPKSIQDGSRMIRQAWGLNE